MSKSMYSQVAALQTLIHMLNSKHHARPKVKGSASLLNFVPIEATTRSRLTQHSPEDLMLLPLLPTSIHGLRMIQMMTHVETTVTLSEQLSEGALVMAGYKLV